MKNSRLGLVCCLIAMVMLLGWAAASASADEISATRIRERLTQTDAETVPSAQPSQSVQRLRELLDKAAVAESPQVSPAAPVTDSALEIPDEYAVVASTDGYTGDGYKGEGSSSADAPYEGEIGYLPYDQTLTEAERRGQQTWYFWTGGNQKFFRNLAQTTHGEADLLGLVDARPDSELVAGDTPHTQREERFETLGVINDPGCRAATKPDEYGLWLDQCDQDPHSTGIMGARKFPNPNFDPENWDVAAYYAAGEERAKIEPPYRVGLSCGICHIAFNPTKPPADPTHPKWENLAGAIGNQYIKEAGLFGGNLSDQDFRKQVLDSQPRGTSDTSRIATDHINNPNAINAIFNLADRPRIEEEMNDGSIQAVPHILKDGADSVGVALASLRVYVNIGMCSDYWLTLHDPLLGRTRQRPFDIDKARRECEDWRNTEVRMADAEKYLETLKPMHLKDAPGGNAYLTKDQAVLERGKIAFADTCATCHSSKQPPADIAVDPEQAKQWYRESVLSSDFLDHNFLSDDRRYPVTQIGTNAARALGTNAGKGHVWAQFSSKTFKELPLSRHT